MNSADRYSGLTHDELVALLERRDARRAYGLVWEREGISPDAAVNDDFVALGLDEALSSAPSEVGAGATWSSRATTGTRCAHCG